MSNSITVNVYKFTVIELDIVLKDVFLVQYILPLATLNSSHQNNFQYSTSNLRFTLIQALCHEDSLQFLLYDDVLQYYWPSILFWMLLKSASL